MNILSQLQHCFRAVLSDVAGESLDAAQLDELADMVRPSQDPKFGDYQANFAMPLGKRLGRPPRDVAKQIVDRLQTATPPASPLSPGGRGAGGEGEAQPASGQSSNTFVDFFQICHPPEIAGPGFINLRLRDDWIIAQLAHAAADPRLGIEAVANPRTYIVDFSAPNVAKPMHVGHIRSTVIGDALCRTLKFLGHRVISDNHIGDWGTQFGMIIYGVKNNVLSESAAEGSLDTVDHLGAIYKEVNRRISEKPEIADLARAETAKLHTGDPENLRLWSKIRDLGLKAIEQTYDILGASFDETLGESFYNDRLAAVVEDLLRRGIARPSEGAIGVFFDDEPESPPFLVQKKDEAFLYATTDLATIQYRTNRWHPDAILYVVDHRQSLHFKHLFKTAERWLDENPVELVHVAFGTVLGDDGKPFKTRSGENIGLSGLLDEAVSRAMAVVSANDDAKPDGAELSPDERSRVAKTVGIGAIKYADLSQNRTSDYVFSYDKMLAMNGNTATYMQYAYARVRSIFARGEAELGKISVAGTPITLGHPAERALALELLRFSEALAAVVADYRPNHLTNYLFALANRYSTFYEQCHVLKAVSLELKRSRLALCDLTARTLRLGLNLLGIDVVEKM
jgi:arginyl-tRNA synthetase